MPRSLQLLATARWLLLAALVAAPWPYAGVPQWAQPWYAGVLGGCFGLWLVARLWQGERLHLPRAFLWSAGVLVLLGWLLIVNAQTRFDWWTSSFLPVDPWWPNPWAPGALDTVEALPAMLRLTGILCALVMLADMARTDVWRPRLFYTLLGGGLAVVVFGLTQRVLHSSFGLWNTAENPNYFATFYYHGNAGAFVNLLVPGLTLLAARRPSVPVLLALGVTLAASVTIASKAAMVLTLLLLLAALVPFLKGTRARLILLSGGLLLCLLPLTLPRVRARWAELPELLQWHNPRLLAWQACLRMLPDAGPWGIGPANFKFAFPHYTAGLHPAVSGFWEYAHEDYLQTAIEWGWCGFVLWAVLIGGALRPGEGTTHRAAFLAMAGLLLHALGDYPLQIPALELYAAGWLGILWSDRSLRLPARGIVAKPHFQDLYNG